VPCYNEEERLDVGAFAAFSRANTDVSFVLVNDGSTDDTLAILERMAALPDGRFACLDSQPNAGKAEAVRRGVLRALSERPDFVGYWDADLATPLSELARFVDVLVARSDVTVVLGSRVGLPRRQIARGLLRFYAGRLFATLAARTLALDLYDTQCGAKLFRVGPGLARVFEAPFDTNWSFDVEILARVRAQKGPGAAAAICELPLTTWSDIAGSKVHSLDFLRALVEVGRIYRRYRS